MATRPVPAPPAQLATPAAQLTAPRGGVAAVPGPLSEEDEFVMGVADVLSGAGVEGPSREVVLGVVERLVSRLHLVQKEKESATHQIRGEQQITSTTQCPKTNPNFRDIRQNVEKYTILPEIFRVASRFYHTFRVTVYLGKSTSFGLVFCMYFKKVEVVR